MSGFFSFDFIYRANAREKSQRCAVIFFSREKVDIGIFSLHFIEHLERNPPPDLIYIVSPLTNEEFLRKLTLDPHFLDRLPGTLRGRAQSVVKRVAIDATGQFLEVSEIGTSAFSDLKIRDAIFNFGLKTVFSRRGGMFPSSPAYHYVKPSGKHCDRFIRSAEILVDGGEVDFIACRLLQFVDDTTDYIFCDTASISQLAYSLMKIRKTLQPTWTNPVVDTFRSYSGIDQYDFRVAHNPLCLISASTSGDMVKRLIDRGLNGDRLVTLFYLGNPKPPGHLVYDLTLDEKNNPDGFETIEVHLPGDCPLCKQGSSRIKMSRDHFVPEGPGCESILIKAKDAPTWMRSFLERYRGTGAIRAHYGRGLRGFTHNIFLDLRRALASDTNPHFRDRLTRLLTQSLPVSLSRIIHLGDPSSVEMAKTAHSLFAKFTSRDVPVLSAAAVLDVSADLVEAGGSTLVIASCIVGGRSLMELSQVLRTIQANGCIVFVIGVARFSNKQILEEARSNVTHTGDRSTDFGFHEVDQVFVPNNTANRPSSWDDEMDFLKKLQLSNSTDEELVEILQRRLDQLREAGSDTNCGLQDDLFWPNVRGNMLLLRPNFAFYRPLEGTDSLTQSEVFFTISCILHNLRQQAPSKRSLDQSEHNRTLIEPTTFYRLNDGLVQASLLRAARASEIDYRLDEVKSATMQEVIKSILIECDKDRGEATIEFLLALAMRHLRLTPSDTNRLISSCSTKLATYPMARCLCTYLREQASEPITSNE